MSYAIETFDPEIILLSILAFFKLESLKIKHKINHFALRTKLLIRANQVAYQELLVLSGA